MGPRAYRMGPNKRQILRWHHTNRAARHKSFVYSGLHPYKDLYVLSKILVAKCRWVGIMRA